MHILKCGISPLDVVCVDSVRREGVDCVHSEC